MFHNSNVFGSRIIHILYTGCAKIKKNNNSGVEGLNSIMNPRYIHNRTAKLTITVSQVNGYVKMGKSKMELNIQSAMQGAIANKE